ncbi:unnamed protein product [Vitrella brassicaformis CCMP3155]|uniref:Histone-lysine N-methyltransferase, H3 lysine-79 specific n=2 Tax=Vitrella brassicaformis TaxID=1169539 RepID=A0A0G4EMU0_VITBC|nr:unnamed protein product [Vitrella brassicaformis CCMP3155]|eukprot:CEL98332.1 unnamed protein product [Vitrella brassicaformis CCMP3155]
MMMIDLSAAASAASAAAEHLPSFLQAITVTDEEQFQIRAIGIAFSAVTVGGGTAAYFLRPKNTEMKFVLSDSEAAAVSLVNGIYDASEEDKRMTERGSIGRTRRQLEADRIAEEFAEGKDPREVRGKTITYSEVDLNFLAVLLRAAEPKQGETFVDLGSGLGRAVLGAAALYPSFRKCTGIEYLQGRTDLAKTYVSRFRSSPAIELMTDDFALPTSAKTDQAIQQADVLFAYSPRFSGKELLSTVEKAKSGARILTVDRKLASDGFELIKTLEDPSGDLNRYRGYVFRRL